MSTSDNKSNTLSVDKADALSEDKSKPEDEPTEELVLATSSKVCTGQAKEIRESEGEEELITFYFISVQFGNLQAVSDCLNCGVSPNVRQPDSLNALHIAAARGNTNMGRLLLSREETDIHIKTIRGMTALHYACNHGHINFVELLLSYNANPNGKSINDATPLHLATLGQSYEVALLLLRHGANPNVLDSFCDTPLTNCVIRKPNFRMAKLLIIDYKTDPNLYCKGQMHIILDLAQCCRTQSQLKFAELLVENGVDVHVTHTATNKNALHFAAMTGYESMISLLLDCGVSTTQKDVWKRTPQRVAEQHGNEGAVDVFITYEALRNPIKY